MNDFHIGMVGVIAGICTTVSFIPQIFKIIKTGHARDISLGMFVILTSGILLWLVYGIMLADLPLILANIVGFILCTFIIGMKIKYRD
jgi:MtN3 and saliva related transmembrane protein